MTDEYLWELSFECGNKVGGIWSVVTSKSREIRRIYGDRYVCIGFFNPERNEVEIEKPPEIFSEVFSELEKEGLRFFYGKWKYANNCRIILVDSRDYAARNADGIKRRFWERFGVDSWGSGFDFNEPLVWSFCAGMLAEKLSQKLPGNHIAQLHEWLSAGALLALKGKMPAVFTTHATVLGRAMKGKPVSDPDSDAKVQNVWAKHQTERTGAVNSEVFTSVSRMISDESEKILGKPADVITNNALDGELVPGAEELKKLKAKNRKKLAVFLEKYFLSGCGLDFGSCPVLYTSGRYEVENKGYDRFIHALGELNRFLGKKKSPSRIVAFILVPAGNRGLKSEIEKAPVCAFDLVNSSDPMLELLKKEGLENGGSDNVKVVYYPVYITEKDEFLGMNYRDFLISADMGVFLSKYEPWGYTPMEAGASMNAAVTTVHSGFAKKLLELGVPGGFFVADDKKSVSKILQDFVNLDKEQRLSLQEKALIFVQKNFVWKKSVKNYLSAYRLAQERFSCSSERKS